MDGDIACLWIKVCSSLFKTIRLDCGKRKSGTFLTALLKKKTAGLYWLFFSTWNSGVLSGLELKLPPVFPEAGSTHLTAHRQRTMRKKAFSTRLNLASSSTSPNPQQQSGRLTLQVGHVNTRWRSKSSGRSRLSTGLREEQHHKQARFKTQILHTGLCETS